MQITKEVNLTKEMTYHSALPILVADVKGHVLLHS